MRAFLIICILIGIVITTVVVTDNGQQDIKIASSNHIDSIIPTPTIISYALLPKSKLDTITLEYWNTDHKLIELLYNPNASDISYSELTKFLLWDNSSDAKRGWTCGHHSESTHNIAERAGIKCYFVVIEFEKDYNTISTRHFLLSFNTTDKGQVFIDCYGGDGVGTVVLNEPYMVADIEYPEYSYMWKDSSNDCTIRRIKILQSAE